MFFPIRWVRQQRSLVLAKQRLHQKHRLVYLKRINRRKYPKQPTIPTKGKVRFTSQSEICHYNVKVCYPLNFPDGVGIAYPHDDSATQLR